MRFGLDMDDSFVSNRKSIATFLCLSTCSEWTSSGSVLQPVICYLLPGCVGFSCLWWKCRRCCSDPSSWLGPQGMPSRVCGSIFSPFCAGKSNIEGIGIVFPCKQQPLSCHCSLCWVAAAVSAHLPLVLEGCTLLPIS